MANLNSWQKLTRVLPGQPFGNGVDGAYSSATIPTLTKDSCSGTATSTTLTTTSATFANGDILLIHQTRGTGVGQWEINKVASGGGSTSLTLQVALNYTYTDSGASQAQAIKIKQYTNVTVQSGTWSVPAWDGNLGGIFPITVKGTLTVTGTITGTSLGFLGGTGNNNSGIPGFSGEGTTGPCVVASLVKNGNGGAGGWAPAAPCGGGNGGVGGGSQGGDAVGTADLLTIDLGGGGGGRGIDGVGDNDGAYGGGIIILIASNVVITGSIASGGGNGPTNAAAGGGGSVLLVGQAMVLGSGLVTATGGTGGTNVGGVGRVAVHHSGTVTGTSNPTFTDITDGTLVESGGSFLFNLT